MNILFLSHHCCIRCVKEGLALIEAGHSVVFLHQRVANPDMQAVLPLQGFYQSDAQLRQKLKTFTDMDVIHVHNEPSSLVWIAKEVRPDLPVIFDVHDLNSVQFRRPDTDEIQAMAAADGVIFPSNGYEQYCRKELKHVFSGLEGTPSRVVYSMCTRQMLEIPPLPRSPGIVYEGRISNNGQKKDYRELFKNISDLNIPIGAFPSNQNLSHIYSQKGVMMMPTLPYMEMMRQISRFDWGFSGPALRCRDGDRGMPNKLFEYIAAGVPVMVHQADEAARFVTDNGLGVAIEDVAEIPEIYGQHEKYRDAVRARRGELVMEGQVDGIVELYRSAERGVRSAEGKRQELISKEAACAS